MQIKISLRCTSRSVIDIKYDTGREDEQRCDKGSSTWGRYINKYISFVQKLPFLPTTSIFFPLLRFIFWDTFFLPRWGGRTVRLLIIISPLIISWRNYTKDDRKKWNVYKYFGCNNLPNCWWISCEIPSDSLLEGFFKLLISCYLDIYTTKHKHTAVTDDPWLFFFLCVENSM